MKDFTKNKTPYGLLTKKQQERLKELTKEHTLQAWGWPYDVRSWRDIRVGSDSEGTVYRIVPTTPDAPTPDSIAIAALTASLALSATAAPAQCARTDNMREALVFSYGETRLATGLTAIQGKLALIEIWHSVETGSFTILLTESNSVSCIRASGKHFFIEPAAQEPEGTPH